MLISNFRLGETSISLEGDPTNKVYAMSSRKLINMYSSVTGALIVRSGTTTIKKYPKNQEMKVFKWDENRVIILEDYSTKSCKLRIVNIYSKKEETLNLPIDILGNKGVKFEIFNRSLDYFYIQGANILRIDYDDKGVLQYTALTRNVIGTLTEPITMTLPISGHHTVYFKNHPINLTLYTSQGGRETYRTLTGASRNINAEITNAGLANGTTLQPIGFTGNVAFSGSYHIGARVTMDFKSIFFDEGVQASPPIGEGAWAFDTETLTGFLTGQVNGENVKVSGGTIIPAGTRTLEKSIIYNRRLYNFYTDQIEWSKPDEHSVVESSVVLDAKAGLRALSKSIDYILYANELGIFKFFHENANINIVQISNLKVIEGGLIPFNTIVYAVTTTGIYSIVPKQPSGSSVRFHARLELLTSHCSHFFDVEITKVSMLEQGTRLSMLLYRKDDTIVRFDIDEEVNLAVGCRYIFNENLSVTLSDNITDYFILKTFHETNVCMFDRYRYNQDNNEMKLIDYLLDRRYNFMDFAQTYNSCIKINCKYIVKNRVHYLIQESTPTHYVNALPSSGSQYLGSLVSVSLNGRLYKIPVITTKAVKELEINLHDKDIAKLGLIPGSQGIIYGMMTEIPKHIINEAAKYDKWAIISEGETLFYKKIVKDEPLTGVYITIGYPYKPSFTVHMPHTDYSLVGLARIKSYGFSIIHVKVSYNGEVQSSESHNVRYKLGVYTLGTPNVSQLDEIVQTTEYTLPYGSFGVVLSIHYKSKEDDKIYR